MTEWRTANCDNVATQPTHYKTNSFRLSIPAEKVRRDTARRCQFA
jgi:hypothetical protein